MIKFGVARVNVLLAIEKHAELVLGRTGLLFSNNDFNMKGYQHEHLFGTLAKKVFHMLDFKHPIYNQFNRCGRERITTY
jgi:hypothetical protein